MTYLTRNVVYAPPPQRGEPAAPALRVFRLAQHGRERFLAGRTLTDAILPPDVMPYAERQFRFWLARAAEEAAWAAASPIPPATGDSALERIAHAFVARARESARERADAALAHAVGWASR